MSWTRLTPTLAIVVAVISSALLPATTAMASGADTTPPTSPALIYSEGFQCLTVIVGASRSTDDVTPRPALRYEAFADGVSIGFLSDRGQPSGPWGVLQLRKAGTSMVAVRSIDAAGNGSAFSRANPVTGYHAPGCTPFAVG